MPEMNQQGLPIWGPQGDAKHSLQVTAPDRLSDWPEHMRPGNEQEEATLIQDINARVDHALEKGLGMVLSTPFFSAIITNRDPRELLADIKKVQAEQLEAMMDPVEMGIGSIRGAVLQARMRHSAMEQGAPEEYVPPAPQWDVIRDLLDTVLSTAALRMNRSPEESDRLRAAELIVLSGTELPIPEGGLAIFRKGEHPVLNGCFDRASEMLAAAAKEHNKRFKRS